MIGFPLSGFLILFAWFSIGPESALVHPIDGLPFP